MSPGCCQLRARTLPPVRAVRGPFGDLGADRRQQRGPKNRDLHARRERTASSDATPGDHGGSCSGADRRVPGPRADARALRSPAPLAQTQRGGRVPPAPLRPALRVDQPLRTSGATHRCVGPRRYQALFALRDQYGRRTRRKLRDGVTPWERRSARPAFHDRLTTYLELEAAAVAEFRMALGRAQREGAVHEREKAHVHEERE